MRLVITEIYEIKFARNGLQVIAERLVSQLSTVTFPGFELHRHSAHTGHSAKTSEVQQMSSILEVHDRQPKAMCSSMLGTLPQQIKLTAN